MISCQRFVFLLTSGELEEAGWLTRLQAGQHRLACRHCRAFAANDRRLDDIVRAQRERWLQPDEPGPDGNGPPGTN